VSDREVTVVLRSLAECGGCSACGAFAPRGPRPLRAGNPRGLSLRPGDVVEIGFDDDGDPMMSCVIEPVGNAPYKSKQEKKRRKRNKSEVTFDEAFSEVIFDGFDHQVSGGHGEWAHAAQACHA